MACIAADGTLSASAKKLIQLLAEPAPLDVIAEAAGLPLFRVRSATRELAEAGLIEEQEGRFVATDKGRALAKAGS
ncbi:MAG: hypothetical protein L0Z53_18055 [Acidobacteriales bacterium]|nr:hypothetical protein [Terriglobales bacterium]